MAGQEKPKVPQEQEKWYFTKEQLQNSASRRCGLDADKELAYRQQAANLIQDMGQRLQVSQLCINTAIVYMHRFYAFHSFTQFHRNAIAAAALFLAAKVEEQPRKLEYVIKVAHVCLHRGESVAQLTTEQYQEQAQDLVFNENVLLQTLGFDVAIDHPHTHVVRTCHLVKAPKDLAQTSYFMASNSLHLTTMCLQYRPTVVACFCIHLASKWSNWAIPQSNEGRHWFWYVDRAVSLELLERLTAEFLHIFDKCPSRLKRKMMTMSNNSGSSPAGAAPAPCDKKLAPPADDFDKSFDREYEREKRRQAVPGGYVPAAGAAPPAQPAQPAPPMKIDYNVYREKREREERDRRQQLAARAAAGATQGGGSRGAGPAPPRPQPAKQAPPPHPWPPSHHHKLHHKAPHDGKEHKLEHKIEHRQEHKMEHKSEHKMEHKIEPKADHRHHRPVPTASTSSAPNPQTTQEIPQRMRPPSLFSPENVTAPTAAVTKWPQQPSRPRPVQEKPPSPKKRPEPSLVEKMQPPTIISPFSSPPVKEKPRQRAHSSSEPELVPVVKKLDETPGYENVLRDSQRGNAIRTKPQEPKPTTRPMNGIETDATLVSNLLKESLAKPAPITVQTEKRSPIEREIKKEVYQPPVVQEPVVVQPKIEPVVVAAISIEEPEQKHKKEKKKKEKHKHKDRDKSKEERKKHKKDKDKEKKKTEEPSPQPPAEDGIRITIPREKLSASPGLKIKIPKERLAVPPPPPQGSGLKIKISKEVLETSRKRTGAQEVGPPNKMHRQNGAPKVDGTGLQ